MVRLRRGQLLGLRLAQARQQTAGRQLARGGADMGAMAEVEVEAVGQHGDAHIGLVHPVVVKTALSDGLGQGGVTAPTSEERRVGRGAGGSPGQTMRKGYGTSSR